eukprot:COSAG06_NODE_8242_length_2225_cov_5.165569_2_plen_77_part_01
MDNACFEPFYAKNDRFAKDRLRTSIGKWRREWCFLQGKIKQARKMYFLSHFYIKMLILPRQARDKHKENSKKKIKQA